MYQYLDGFMYSVKYRMYTLSNTTFQCDFSVIVCFTLRLILYVPQFDDLLLLVQPHCVKGDGRCPDSSVLGGLRLLEHGRPCSIDASSAEENPATPNDCEMSMRLRMNAALRMLSLEWKVKRVGMGAENLDGVVNYNLILKYLDAPVYSGDSLVTMGQYGDLNTLGAEAEDLRVDIVCIDKTKPMDTSPCLQHDGKEVNMSLPDIIRRVRNPAEVPFIVVLWNGIRGPTGHYMACVYLDSSGNLVRPPSTTPWQPPSWLSVDSARWSDEFAPNLTNEERLSLLSEFRLNVVLFGSLIF